MLRDTAGSRLPGDGLHSLGPAAGDDDGAINNLRQQLALAIRVSSISVFSVSSAE